MEKLHENLPLPETEYESDYPLQGTELDVVLEEVLALDAPEREQYVRDVLSAFAEEISKNQMALKTKKPFKKELNDLRKVLRYPADSYLYTDERNYQRNVLGKGAPGLTHTDWSRKVMWQMSTRQGHLSKLIENQDERIVRRVSQILNPEIKGKRIFRRENVSAILSIIHYLQMEFGVATAFPPFHAKFLADKFLPQKGRCLVVDPCAGWGGRLFGTLCVNRRSPVKYVGIDPEKRNKEAYEGLLRRINVYMKKEIKAKRYGQFFYRPFEDWIVSASAKKLYGKADLVMTSPPYFSAEVYNTDNKNQSANKFLTYGEWREGFYKVLVQGAYDLLKDGGIFVLNIADVVSAERLEKDARALTKEIGFENAGFYKLAMSINPGNRHNPRHTVIVNGKVFKYEPVFCFRKIGHPSRI
jgi:tRNA1(Val) A37 N6-methylase TrmN6